MILKYHSYDTNVSHVRYYGNVPAKYQNKAENKRIERDRNIKIGL